MLARGLKTPRIFFDAKNLYQGLTELGWSELNGTFIFIKGLGIRKIVQRLSTNDSYAVKLDLGEYGIRVVSYWTVGAWRPTLKELQNVCYQRGWLDSPKPESDELPVIKIIVHRNLLRYADHLSIPGRRVKIVPTNDDRFADSIAVTEE